MRIPFVAAVVLLPALLFAQIPPGYYDPAQGLTGEALRTALNGIISPHTVLQYSQLWAAFYRTDRRANNTVWDIYSDVPGGPLPYSYQFVTDQCGTYTGEGDCFNREHSFPVGWFNDVPPMNTDLFHIYPTDGWVNAQRGSWPYGTVNAPAYTSDNGSKRGPCTWPGCTGTVFEPINEYKGDLARGYLYMLTRYLNESQSWSTPITTGNEFFGWTESLLVAWCTQDPVSAKEIARNDSIYRIQGNRNPYIDNPQWVYSIWGPQAAIDEVVADDIRAWYAEGVLTIDLDPTLPSLSLSVRDALGRTVLQERSGTGRTAHPIDLVPGTYCLVIGDVGQRRVVRFVR